MIASRPVCWGAALAVAAALSATTAARAVAAGPESEPGVSVATIDAGIAEAWEAAGIEPSPRADDAEFLRRVYLDLLGRIPSVPEALAFLQNRDAGKREKLVDYLLDHPDYAKNFGTIWTNLLVGRRVDGNDVDRGALAGWVRRQFAEDRPWDEMARELIAATGSNKENGAVNYTLAHRAFEAVPLTSITTRLFLGKQLQCTQCHDHPSNAWKQEDFWGINAFFRGTRAERVTRVDASGAEVADHVELFDGAGEPFASFEKRNGMFGSVPPTFLDGRKIPLGEDVKRRAELARFITDDDDGQLARAFVNRMWGHFFGRGFVQPVDDFGPHNPPTHPELLDAMAEEFRAGGYDVKGLVRAIVLSEAYHLSSVPTKQNAKDETLYSHMSLKPMSPEQLFESLLTATRANEAGGGDTDALRDRWLGQFIFAFANDEDDESTNFQGTIPQALMMMNGDLMARATGGRSGSFLARLLDEARAQRAEAPEVFVVRRLYLASYGRFPTKAELRGTLNILGSYPDTIDVVEDLFWAMLNSNEFILNR